MLRRQSEYEVYRAQTSFTHAKMQLPSLFLLLSLALNYASAAGPFLQTSGSSHIIGNDLWNLTVGQTFGKKLFYKNKDLVGGASGHYASIAGGTSLSYTSASIVKQTADFIDVSFSASQGEMHWVIYKDLAGAYQYFVNHALPVIGEFRTIWRLDPKIFVNGKTDIKDGPLPTLAEISAATNVQDETWRKADGTYITKYDWSDFIHNPDFYGVYGSGFGSWYVHPSKDYYNGNHLKQELMVHRETSSGDVVKLNMIHGSHFQAASSDSIPDGKVWGPWLWYINDGSIADVQARATLEKQSVPYTWFDNAAYQSRGQVSGVLTLSDGRAAAGAVVFLGDNKPTKTALDMGTTYYYTAYADAQGNFKFDNVRSGVYGLQAWANGGAIKDVSTTFLKNDVTVQNKQTTALGSLSWKTQGRQQIFQIGDMDRTSLGFKYGGAPYQHALMANCAANMVYTIGTSKASDWCYAQSALGTWSIKFNINALPANSAGVLSVSLAGFSSGCSLSIVLNGGTTIGTLGSGLANDPSLYRSGTLAGEWRYAEFAIAAGGLKVGANTIDFTIKSSTLWRGFMYDSVILEFA